MRRKRWMINPEPATNWNARYFNTRQEAVEWANDHYERTGELVEIKETIRPNRRA